MRINHCLPLAVNADVLAALATVIVIHLPIWNTIADVDVFESGSWCLKARRKHVAAITRAFDKRSL
jgi:hypothetical protein